MFHNKSEDEGSTEIMNEIREFKSCLLDKNLEKESAPMPSTKSVLYDLKKEIDGAQ